MPRSEKPESVAQMLGGLLREGGILGLVFGCLDEFHKEGWKFDRTWIVGVCAISLLAIAVGVIVERERVERR